MANLKPLIRVRKHAVEQKQKFLAELYRQAEEFAAQKQALIDQLADERTKMDEMEDVVRMEAMTHYGLYAQGVRSRIEDLEGHITKLDGRIEVAREDMRQAFAELKKIEITQERREDEEEAEVKKKESDELDEIAIENFRRQKKEENA